MSTITWNSKPDYDEWGWDSYWSCQDWKTWHKRLVEHYGSKEGSEIWLNAWYDPKNDSWLVENTDWCGFDSNFTDHFIRYGIDLRNPLKRNLDSVQSLFSSVQQGISTTFNILPWVFGLGAAYALYRFTSD